MQRKSHLLKLHITFPFKCILVGHSHKEFTHVAWKCCKVRARSSSRGNDKQYSIYSQDDGSRGNATHIGPPRNNLHPICVRRRQLKNVKIIWGYENLAGLSVLVESR